MLICTVCWKQTLNRLLFTYRVWKRPKQKNCQNHCMKENMIWALGYKKARKKFPHNRRDWWHSPVILLLGDKDMEWLEKSSLNALLVSWIHIDVDFKSGPCCTAWKIGTSMIQTVYSPPLTGTHIQGHSSRSADKQVTVINIQRAVLQE